jgi:hypothetical protein
MKNKITVIYKSFNPSSMACQVLTCNRQYLIGQ